MTRNSRDSEFCKKRLDRTRRLQLVSLIPGYLSRVSKTWFSQSAMCSCGNIRSTSSSESSLLTVPLTDVSVSLSLSPSSACLSSRSLDRSRRPRPNLDQHLNGREIQESYGNLGATAGEKEEQKTREIRVGKFFQNYFY